MFSIIASTPKAQALRTIQTALELTYRDLALQVPQTPDSDGQYRLCADLSGLKKYQVEQILHFAHGARVVAEMMSK